MSRYGTAIYGVDFYGEPGGAAYSAEPFIALEQNYGVIRLTYTTPGGDWNQMRLVRNYLGYPIAEDDGDILFDVQNGDPLSIGYLDSGLPQGRWVYYSIFVFSPENTEWVYCGSTRGYSVKNFNGGQHLYDAVPRPFKGLSLQSPDVNEDLLSFCTIFGFSYDLLRNMGFSLLSLHDPMHVNYDLLPLQMADFGIPREFELEPEQYRRFLDNAVYLYKTKGTEPCVHGVVTAVTGYDSLIGIGDNLLWGADFSDFLNGIGTWAASGSTNTHVALNTGFITLSGQIINTLRATAIASGSIALALCPAADVLRLGLPVAHNKKLSLTLQMSLSSAEAVTDATITYGYQFYDNAGNHLSGEDATANTTSLRQLVLTQEVLNCTVPPDAVYAIPIITGTDMPANAYLDVSGVRVNYGEAPSIQYGRDIRITLLADRVNIVENSSFELDTTGWLTENATLDVDDTKFFDGAGVKSGRITPTTLAGGLAYYTLKTKPGNRYGVQVAVAGDNTSGSVYVTSGAPGNDPLTDVNGAQAEIDFELSEDVEFSEDDIPTIPFVAASAETILVVSVDATTGSIKPLWIDAVIVETAATGQFTEWVGRDLAVVKPYFDGASTNSTDDFFWEGAPYESRSHFYYRRAIHEARLRGILPRYLPIGATYTLLWAQPDQTFFLNDDLILFNDDPSPAGSVVSMTKSMRWAVEAFSSKTFIVEWNVSNLRSVSKSVSIEWDDHAHVAKTFTPKWDTLVHVSRTRTAEWNVLAAAFLELVQQKYLPENDSSVLSARVLSFDDAVADGNTVVVQMVLHHSSTPSVTSVTGLGATWSHAVISPQAASDHLVYDIWVGFGCSGGGTDITVNTNIAADCAANISEWPDLNPVGFLYPNAGTKEDVVTSFSTDDIAVAGSSSDHPALLIGGIGLNVDTNEIATRSDTTTMTPLDGTAPGDGQSAFVPAYALVDTDGNYHLAGATSTSVEFSGGLIAIPTAASMVDVFVAETPSAALAGQSGWVEEGPGGSGTQVPSGGGAAGTSSSSNYGVPLHDVGQSLGVTITTDFNGIDSSEVVVAAATSDGAEQLIIALGNADVGWVRRDTGGVAGTERPLVGGSTISSNHPMVVTISDTGLVSVTQNGSDHGSYQLTSGEMTGLGTYFGFSSYQQRIEGFSVITL